MIGSPRRLPGTGLFASLDSGIRRNDGYKRIYVFWIFAGMGG
jgi:hypothetical protein